MYYNNIFNKDPTHVITAKYYVKQTLQRDSNGKDYLWDSFVSFRCAIVQPKRNAIGKVLGGNVATAANSLTIETKHQGLSYKVGGVVQIGDKIYTVRTVDVDYARVAPQSFLTVGNNPNTYYKLSLVETTHIDTSATNPDLIDDQPRPQPEGMEDIEYR